MLRRLPVHLPGVRCISRALPARGNAWCGRLLAQGIPTERGVYRSLCSRVFTTGRTHNSFGAWEIPDPMKAVGEDAFFLHVPEQANLRFLGIADGVGGWSQYGVDPSLYSAGLMRCAAQQASQHTCPVSLLEVAYIQNCDDKVVGSSTACIVMLDEAKGVLVGANLGDSGFMVLRDGKCVFRSTEQCHAFNTPLQLGTDSGDKPRHCDLTEVPMEGGEILVLGTDGLFDNLYDDEIISCVQAAQRKTIDERVGASTPLGSFQGLQLGPERGSGSGSGRGDDIDIATLIARELAHTAHAVANNELKLGPDTPFERAVRKTGHAWKGGKMDDITVVVGVLGK